MYGAKQNRRNLTGAEHEKKINDKILILNDIEVKIYDGSCAVFSCYHTPLNILRVVLEPNV